MPKGPSLVPAVKRLAIQVEDHPVEYGSFEGMIPEGEYGGGTVMLWDHGWWEPVGDAHEGYRQGKLKFRLHGEKLRGGWMLLRTRVGRADPTKPQWLLFKERDDEAKPAKQTDVLEKFPLSVKSRRSMEEIANKASKPSSNGKPARRARRPTSLGNSEKRTTTRRAPPASQADARRERV